MKLLVDSIDSPLGEFSVVVDEKAGQLTLL